jgi:steroid delta-isomerase-like uncharacterized protein
MTTIKPGLATLALAGITACAGAQPPPSSTNRSTNMTTPTPAETTPNENRRRVEALFATFNDGELDRLDELIAKDYVGPRGDKGPAGFRELVVGLRTAFPDLHYTIDDLVAGEDRVAIRWHWTGTHEGPFRGFAPTHKAVTSPGMAIFRLEGHKIVAGALETDRLGFLQQIGVVPANIGLGGPPPAPR